MHFRCSDVGMEAWRRVGVVCGGRVVLKVMEAVLTVVELTTGLR